MSKSIDRKVLLPILATDTHCDNSCSSINFTSDPAIAECLFFNEEMGWDSRKQSNGYIRLSACRQAEVRPTESPLFTARWLAEARIALAEGRRIPRREIELLMREIGRLRANEAIFQSELGAAIRRAHELRVMIREMRDKLDNVSLGIGMMLNGE